ncbi:MAG: MBL fold metallo-hydrolase [Oligoflexia bacterium]|nr:MBL fold metallo-hydrolase [Oligoflexia bacterium]
MRKLSFSIYVVIYTLLFCIDTQVAFASQIFIKENPRYHGPQIKYVNGRYFNPEEYGGSDRRYLVDGFKIFLQTFHRRSKDFFDGVSDRSNWYQPAIPSLSSVIPKITWIGHSSFLIQLNGINILTDPVFNDLFKIYYTRTFPPGISYKNLANKINVILISHNHKDHFEKKTMKKLLTLNPQPLLLVPQGLKKWFLNLGYNNDRIFEFDWGNEIHSVANSPVNITFLPAKHTSSMLGLDINKSAWGSWLIENSKIKIFFAGDTGDSAHFQEIAKSIGKIDVAIMPIAPNKPRKLMEKVCHINTEDSASAGFITLDAKWFIPMHWGTFKLGSDKFIEPITRLEKWFNSNQYRLPNKNLVILPIGGIWKFYQN